jgi:hypothetical protein
LSVAFPVLEIVARFLLAALQRRRRRRRRRRRAVRTLHAHLPS